MVSEILESDKLYLFLLSDGTRIDNNEYLQNLEATTELVVCTEEQMCKLLSTYFDIKRYLQFKNISYLVNIDYFCIIKL